MTNNTILKSLRYTFNFNDSKMIKIFGLADLAVTREEVSQWLKKDDDPDYKSLHDLKFSIFLSGLINYKRGKKEGPQPAPDKRLDNNIIFRKLKIALDLKNEDVLEVMQLTNFKISNQELSAFFRRADHKHYRKCKDQVMRNFLKGLQLKYRPAD